MRAENKKSNSAGQIRHYLKNRTLQTILIGITIIATAFAIVENGALPRKYRLILGEKSSYDITAPRDIENTLLTLKMAEKAAEAVPPVMLRLESVPIDVLNAVSEFIKVIEDSRQGISKSLQEQGITKKSADYKKVLEFEQSIAVNRLILKIKEFNVPLSEEQVRYLIVKASEEELAQFDRLTRELVSSIMKEEINDSNLAAKIDFVQNEYQSSNLSQDFKNIGSLMAKAFLKPNSVIAQDLTDEKKKEAYNAAMESKQIITRGSRIISYGDIVTEDKLEVLKELDLVETGKLDYAFASGVLAFILLLAFILVIYMHVYCRKLLDSRRNIILLGSIIILTLVLALILNPVNPLLIPVFITPMLVSILLELRLGVIINLLVVLAVSLITKGDHGLLYTGIIGGTLSAFIVSGTNQRSRLSVSGLVIAVISGAVTACVGLIDQKNGASIANDAAFAILNGILSTIFTIGALPFFESVFGILTPLKLLELANPNQPLMKRLLIEAPGTYHHSLMVGNLAEVAAEAVNGNALLARVGAYYHDVGKLRRPNFFKENQLSENPHDRITPNLSSLVITSHTSDGVEIADKYKVPKAVCDIISQHHGTTLAAYFYHKAKKSDRTGTVKQEDFRYPGPRPSSKEAAVVMLADSVEAAVRSMADKTEGKMEALIRRIIKDKLDDGQLDLCELTLRDLDIIARAFTRVFGGYFHEREEYPEIKEKKMYGTDKDDEISDEHIEVNLNSTGEESEFTAIEDEFAGLEGEAVGTNGKSALSEGDFIRTANEYADIEITTVRLATGATGEEVEDGYGEYKAKGSSQYTNNY